MLWITITGILTTISAHEIIGYYPSWQWYDRSNLAQPQNLDFTKLSTINFAFFQTDNDGNLYATDPWTDSTILFGPIDPNHSPGSKRRCTYDAPNTLTCNHHFVDQGLISLAHQHGAHIFPSIGGWISSNHFPKVAASDTARKHFAQQCVELITRYEFDGIDLDWESPGYGAYGGTSDDQHNFNMLLQEIRSALDVHTQTTAKYYPLTAALPCASKHMAHINVSLVHSVLDQIHLITYDFHGSWDGMTGVNAPLYEVKACVSEWISRGATKGKINIGLPFYGRSFKNANGLNQSHHGADTVHWADDDGTPRYYNIVKRLDEMVSGRDESSGTPYAYFDGTPGGLVSYDDPVSICEKVEYVLDDGLNGVMIWDITGDLMDNLSTPLLDEVNLKFMFPDEHSCGAASVLPDPIPPPTASSGIQAPSTEVVRNGKCGMYTEDYVQSLLDTIRDLNQQMEDCEARNRAPTRVPSKLLSKG